MSFLRLLYLLYLFIFSPKSSNKQPVRLYKKEEPKKSSFERTCEKVCPYILLTAMIIFSVLVAFVLAKYGHSITGTEANNYYYHILGD